MPSYMKKDGNSRGASHSKIAPPLASGKNYHRRTLNVKFVGDEYEFIFFRATITHGGDFLTVTTPSGKTDGVLFRNITAVSHQEEDGLYWLTVCTARSEEKQKSIGRNLLIDPVTKKRKNITGVIDTLDNETF